MIRRLRLLLVALYAVNRLALGFSLSSPSSHQATRRESSSALLLLSERRTSSQEEGTSANNDDDAVVRSENRRNLFSSVVSSAAFTLVTSSSAAVAETTGTKPEVRGTDVTPFNGLMFQYRGSEFAGLKASDIDGPSISYADFMSRLKAGEVEFVEFIAPDGDEAYATFKSSSNGKKEAPIRIGEGYPIERHDGYSSPAFAVRAVANAGVPYRFTVPALRSLQQQ